MNIHELIKKLYSSNEYNAWEKEGYYLAHVFVMMDEANKDVYQVGFYNAEKDRMVTFIMNPNEISMTGEQEVMKAKQKIGKLDIEKVKITVEEALETSKKCFSENYKNNLKKVSVNKVLYIKYEKLCKQPQQFLDILIDTTKKLLGYQIEQLNNPPKSFTISEPKLSDNKIEKQIIKGLQSYGI